MKNWVAKGIASEVNDTSAEYATLCTWLETLKVYYTQKCKWSSAHTCEWNAKDLKLSSNARQLIMNCVMIISYFVSYPIRHSWSLGLVWITYLVWNNIILWILSFYVWILCLLYKILKKNNRQILRVRLKFEREW